MPSRPYCVFCRIVAGEEPANIIYQDDDMIVIQNVLRWVPVMLLAMTKEHTTQSELWGEHIGKVGRVAMEIGKQVCPGGFRLLSNWGYDAMQSQEHGHVHILGGTYLGHYVG
ncbi:MAG: HIT domain-containing protein [Dehalococcoidia bacterium]